MGRTEDSALAAPGMPDRDMPAFRVIVVVDGERTIQVVVPFEHVPHPGEVISLPQAGNPVTVRHVINAPRAGLAGIILAWAS